MDLESEFYFFLLLSEIIFFYEIDTSSTGLYNAGLGPQVYRRGQVPVLAENLLKRRKIWTGSSYLLPPCIGFRLRHFRCKEFYPLVLWIWNQNIAISTMVGTSSHINQKGNYSQLSINRKTSGKSASFPQSLGSNTVFDMRLRVTFLRRKTA
jgi:hypothetical protein